MGAKENGMRSLIAVVGVLLLVACGSSEEVVVGTATPGVGSDEVIANVVAHLGVSRYGDRPCPRIGDVAKASAEYVGGGKWLVTAENGREWDVYDRTGAVVRVGSVVC
jgi:hypothetical protein